MIEQGTRPVGDEPMKLLRWMTCGLVLLAVAVGPALAQDADEGAKKPRKRTA